MYNTIAFLSNVLSGVGIKKHVLVTQSICCVSLFLKYILIRAVAGQRSSPDLCVATKFIKIYDP